MTILAVLLGGLIGTALRLGVDAALPHAETGFPFSTLVVNVLGSFLLGLVVARLWPVAPAWLRAGLGPGVLGSFTTFSALAVSLVALADAGEWALAIAYLAATLALGLGAAFAGLALGRRRGVPPIGVDE